MEKQKIVITMDEYESLLKSKKAFDELKENLRKFATIQVIPDPTRMGNLELGRVFISNVQPISFRNTENISVECGIYDWRNEL